MAAHASEPEEAPEPEVHVVEFLIGGERFAIGVELLDNIVELEESARVPRTSEAIEGMMDLRGEITAIIDPSVYLDSEANPPSKPQVLILDDSVDKQKLGFRVDDVVGVEAYPESAIEPPETVEELDTSGFEQGTIQSIIRSSPEGGSFEPIAWLDVEGIIERSRAVARRSRVLFVVFVRDFSRLQRVPDCRPQTHATLHLLSSMGK